MKNDKRYWVFDWLDHYQGSSIERIDLLLSNGEAFDDLRRGAAKALRQFGKTMPSADSVLIGRGIDLSGQLDCFAPSWRKQQAHRLFNKVWHYFDKIVIEDSIAHELALHKDDTRIPQWISAHLELLLFLREIGAEPLLEFRLKPPPCQVHLAQHVEEAGLSQILAAEDEIAELITENANITLKRHSNGTIDYVLNFDEFWHTQWGTIPAMTAKGLSENQIKLIAGRKVFEEFLAYLASDTRAAKLYKTPLGVGIPFHQRLLQKANSPTVADVAMNIQLPVLEGLSPELLLNIRRDEHEYFDRFRTQLRLAIIERLKATELNDPATIAKEIQKDLIEPEINAIRGRLIAAEKTVTKKSAVGMFLGTLTTTCGLLGGATPSTAVLAGVTAATAITGNAVNKYLDEINDVALNAMYFAWRAEKHLET